MRILTPEHDAALARVQWPAYVARGFPAAIAVDAAGTLLSIPFATGTWRGVDPPAAVVLLVVAGLGAVATARPALAGRHLAFGAAVLAPLAVLHVGGDAVGMVPVTGEIGLYNSSLLALVVLIGDATLRAPRRVCLALVLLYLAVVAAAMVTWPYPLPGFVVWFLALAASATSGLAGRALFVSLLLLEEAQHELAERAVADERRRVARDVHDVVAHTLSVTMLHLTAARLAVERAPDRAAEALGEAERQGRASLADLRRVVRLLRGDDTSLGRAQPTLDELPDLAAAYRRAGLPVTYTGVEGPTAGVSPVVATTLYRLAQESLANAAKHGAGGAEVRLAVGADGARLTVRNPCAAVPPGRASAGGRERGSGLAGMEERVLGLGGVFRAGPEPPAPSAGAAAWAWEVEAFLPALPAEVAR